MDEFGYISWPTMPDGSEFDGRNLLQLHAKHENPFAFNLQALLNEVEETLVLQIMDISMVGSGANRLVCLAIAGNAMQIDIDIDRGLVVSPRTHQLLFCLTATKFTSMSGACGGSTFI